MTVVFLNELIAALPVERKADCLFATCSDRYASFFTRAFIARYRPFLVVAIDGAGPDRWPLPEMTGNPAPWAIGVSSRLVPAAGAYPDIEHKKPWSVVKIEFGRFDKRFAGAYSGRWASISARAKRGRVIWENSCDSCHLGPGRIFSGNQARQPFAILAAVAKGDPGLFRRYVRDPKSVIATARMEPHPRYSDIQLADLIAFVTAERN